jgi:hypothetical protein
MYAHTAYISSTPISAFSNGKQWNWSNNILKSLLLISNRFFVFVCLFVCFYYLLLLLFFFFTANGISAVVAWIIPALCRMYISPLYEYCRCIMGGNIVGKMLFHVRF